MIRKHYILFISLVTAFILSGCGNKANVDNKDVITVNMAVSGDNVDNGVPSYNPREDYGSYDGNGYCQFRNIALEEPSNLTLDAVIYYQNNPEEYNMTVPANIIFGQIDISEENDSRIYNIPVSISLEELYSKDNVKYSGCITPSIEFADNNTGGIIPVRDTKGNDEYKYGVTFSKDGADYTISCGCKVNVITGDYKPVGNGDYARDVRFDAVYTVYVPLDYDGLVMKISPCNQYRIVNTENVDETIKLLDEELYSGTVFIKL